MVVGLFILSTMPIRIVKDTPQKSKLYTRAEEYKKLKDEIKSLTAKAETLKSMLKGKVVEEGYETPQGHKIIAVAPPKGSELPTIILKANIRTTTYLKPNAIDVIKEKLPDYSKKIIETTEVVREDRLQTLIEEDKIGIRISKQIYGQNDSYAFSCDYEKSDENGEE